MRRKFIILCISLQVSKIFAIPVEVLSDSWSTMMYQAKSIVQMAMQVQALTTQVAWMTNSSNYNNLQSLANTLNGIQTISYTGTDVANRFAKLYPGAIGDKSLKNAASYQKIATSSLQSASAVLQGLSIIQQTSSTSGDPVSKILSMANTSLTQADLAKAGAEIAIQEYNALRNLQEVNSMQTQLIAQQVATSAQKEADTQNQVKQLKELTSYKAN